MKKKIYFIIASSISFLLSIFSIIKANETVKATVDSLKEVYAGFPQDFQNRVIGVYQSSGVKFTILFAIIVMISSIFIFLFAIQNSLLRHKGLVITFSIFTFFFTDVLLVQLIGIADFIIILCCKRKNPEDFPDKTKKEIPKLELKESSIKEKILSIILFVVYLSQFIWSKFLPDNFNILLITEILFNIIMITCCILLFFDQIKYSFSQFKNNFKAYMRFIMPRLGMSYVFLFIFSLISTLITHNAVSVNQETLESLPIYYIIPGAVIYAPIVEEILFRGVIRKFIKNSILFIIVSAITFGVLHTIEESSLLNILVMSLPYCSLGAYLAYVYIKSNNIFTSIISHAIFNSISVIFMILI